MMNKYKEKMRSHAKWRDEDGWSTLIHQLIRIRWAKIGPPHLNISSPAQSLIIGTLFTQTQAHLFFLISLLLSPFVCAV